MYKMLYGDRFLFDPFDDERIVGDAKLTNNINAASYLDFTIYPGHPLYDVIEERSETVRLWWDNEELFKGQIYKIDIGMEGLKSVSCNSALEHLKDVQLRPYSTDAFECEEYEYPLDKAPDTLAGYFQWVIDQYNELNLTDTRFSVHVNQADYLTDRTVYFSSTSAQTVAEAIDQNILGSYGGYLSLRYKDDELMLDLYSDIHEMNPQIIDFGENILDITKAEDTTEQYTAVYPTGHTPQYTKEQQKYHDERAIYEQKMKERDDAQRAKIDKLKQEEDAEQRRIDGMPKGEAKTNAQNALKRRKEQREAQEKSFQQETERLRDQQRVKDDKNSADKTKPNPITIESLPDGGYSGDLDILKRGDVVYSASAVERYGYKEYAYSESDIEDKEVLLRLAVVKLKTLMAPVTTVVVRAVDQATYHAEHTHLFVGQAVRVRSKIQHVDEYMMVSSIELDLNDPSRTTATLGVAYDTLTGQQSSYLKNLNSQIVASVDEVKKVSEDVKTTEITIGKLENAVVENKEQHDILVNTVESNQWVSNTAYNNAQEASEAAAKANEDIQEVNTALNEHNAKLEALDESAKAMDGKIKETEEKAQNAVASIETLRTDVETDIQGVRDDVAAVSDKADTIKTEANKAIEEVKESVNAVSDKADTIKTEANKAIEGIKASVNAVSDRAEAINTAATSAIAGVRNEVQNVKTSAENANAKANELQKSLDDANAVIETHTTKLGGLETTLSNTTQTAESALAVASSAKLEAGQVKITANSAYADAQSALTKASELKSDIDGLSLNLSNNYYGKGDADALFATNASLQATSNSIKTEVSKTYATKESVDTLQNIADNAIESWTGTVVPTVSNAPANTWTTKELKKRHSGDIYYNMSTGKSYRWGSTDGNTYSWTMIADSDITKAIADAAKAQQTADGAKQDVVNLSNDVKATYTSKSEFKQTSDEIKASVSEVASANETNTEKIADLSVKADGISATVREQAETISGHTTTIGQLSVKADGLQTKFEQVSDDLGHVRSSIPGLINPNFTDGNYGWIHNGASFRISTYDASLNGPYLVGENFKENGTYELINKGLLSLTPGHKYRISILMQVNTKIIQNTGFSLRFIKTYSPYVDYPNAVTYINTADITDGRFVTYSREITCPAKVTQGYFRLAAFTKAGSYIMVKSVDIVDITEGSAALTKTSQLEQNLDGFKQTVTESYLKKGEADTKYTSKSEFAQTTNEIKGTIQEQAETISGHTSTIGALSLKADKFEIDISQVTEQATAIAGRTTKLEQGLDGFKQTVSETYTTKDEFDNLQIGGRNLLLNTKTSKQMVGNNGINQTMTLYTLSTHSWSHLDPGDYMISADISYEGTISGKFAFQRDNTPWLFTPAPGKNFADIITDSKRKAHVEFCVTNAYDGATKGLAVRFDNVQGTVTFSNMKLEKGNKATTWSPAPEDLLDTETASATYTTKSEFNQTANEIKGTVAEQATTINGHTSTIGALSLKADKFETDISQVTEQATAIASRTTKLEQGLDGFKQTVSETYTTKTETEDAINGVQIGGTNLSIAGGYYGNSGLKNFTYTRADDQYDFDVSAADSGVWGHRMAPNNACTNNRAYPWGQWGTVSFDVYSDRECTLVTDINNKLAKSSSGGNDCDLRSKAKKMLPDGSIEVIGGVGGANETRITIPAQRWVRIAIMCYNFNSSANPNHVDLLDYSSIGFLSLGEDFHVKVRKIKFEVGNKPTAWSPCPLDMLDKASAATEYTTKSEFTQTANEIKGTVAEQATTINGHTNTIGALSLKADKFETDISQVTEQANAIAVRTTKLEQNLDGFKTTVSQTYLPKTDFDNLKIGGRNLWVWKGFLRQYVGNQGIIGGSNQTVDAAMATTVPCAGEKNVIIQSWNLSDKTVSNSNATGRMAFFKADGTFIKLETTIAYPNCNYKYSTKTVPIPAEAAYFRASIVYPGGPALAGDPSVFRVKFEFGNKPTDWTPAPEDMVSQTEAETTYTTKSEFSQEKDKITLSVSEAATTANSALSKANTLEQTAGQLQSSISEQAKTISGHTTSINTLTQTASSLSSQITQVGTVANMGLLQADDYIIDGSFEKKQETWPGVQLPGNGINPGGFRFSDNTFNSGKTCLVADSGTGSIKQLYLTHKPDKCIGDDAVRYISVLPGHVYRLSGYIMKDRNYTASDPGNDKIRIGNDKGSLVADYPFGNITQTGSFVKFEMDIVPNSDQGLLSIAIRTTGTNSWIAFDDFSFRDVTEAKAAQTTANDAISRYSTLKQDLDGFKTTVGQTYETKTDALSKKSSLETTINSFKTEVSTTYAKQTALTTVSDKLDNLKIGGRNLAVYNQLTNYNSNKFSYDRTTNTYTMVAPVGTSTWGYGARIKRNDASINGHNVLVPWGMTIIKSFEAYSPVDAQISSDFDLYPVSGSNWNSNDNDLGSSRSPQIVSIKGGEWTKVWWRTTNANPRNTNKVDLVDNSNFGLVTSGFTQPTEWKIRNFKAELGNIPTDWTPAPEDMATALELSEQKSYIDQQDSKIELGVKNTYQTKADMTGYAKTADVESKISASKSGILLEVSNKYASKELPQQLIDNLKVGDTNLLQRTQWLDRTGVSASETGYMNVTPASYDSTNYLGKFKVGKVTSSGNVLLQYSIMDVEPNTDYVFSWYGKGTSAINAYFYGPTGYIKAIAVDYSDGMSFVNNAYADGKISFQMTSEWKRYWVHWKTAETMNGATTKQKYALLRDDSNVRNAYAAAPKLEKGTKPTEWSPSPWDLGDAQTLREQGTKIEQNANNIALKVSTKDLAFGDNIWPNQWCEPSTANSPRYQIGSPYTGTEVAPSGGKIFQLNSRDHFNGDFPLRMPSRLRIIVEAKRIAGTRNLNAGIWRKQRTEGNTWAYWGATKTEALTDGWQRLTYDFNNNACRVGALYFQIDQSGSSPDTTWLISNIRFYDITDSEELNAKIDVRADAITSEVTQKINDISIGSRNLMKLAWMGPYTNNTTWNYSNYFQDGGFSFTRTNSRDGGVYMDNYQGVQANKEYIVHFQLRVKEGNVSKIFIYVGLNGTTNNTPETGLFIDGVRKGNGGVDIPFTPVRNQWYDIEYRYRTSASSVNKATWNGHVIQLNKNESSVNYTAEVRGFMWEEGNKPTGWNPAPEDMASSSMVVQTKDAITTTINQQVNTINQSINQTNANLNSTNQAVSTINSNVNTVTQNVNTLQTYITQKSEGILVGKNVNGKPTGYIARVNSMGSFDILDASRNNRVIASMGTDGLEYRKYYDNNYMPADAYTNWTIGFQTVQSGPQTTFMLPDLKFPIGTAFNSWPGNGTAWNIVRDRFQQPGTVYRTQNVGGNGFCCYDSSYNNTTYGIYSSADVVPQQGVKFVNVSAIRKILETKTGSYAGYDYESWKYFLYAHGLFLSTHNDSSDPNATPTPGSTNFKSVVLMSPGVYLISAIVDLRQPTSGTILGDVWFQWNFNGGINDWKPVYGCPIYTALWNGGQDSGGDKPGHWVRATIPATVVRVMIPCIRVALRLPPDIEVGSRTQMNIVRLPFSHSYDI